MAIARYENIDINRVTNGVNTYGEQTTTITKWFTTRGRVKTPNNSLSISGDTRFYTDLLDVVTNFTPNMREIFNNQNLYSITWRGKDWRITNVRESDDRMNVIFSCYRNDPVVPV